MVGIYAHRYGYVPQGRSISITEEEFAYARDQGKALFCLTTRIIPGRPNRWKMSLDEVTCASS